MVQAWLPMAPGSMSQPAGARLQVRWSTPALFLHGPHLPLLLRPVQVLRPRLRPPQFLAQLFGQAAHALAVPLEQRDLLEEQPDALGLCLLSEPVVVHRVANGDLPLESLLLALAERLVGRRECLRRLGITPPGAM